LQPSSRGDTYNIFLKEPISASPLPPEIGFFVPKYYIMSEEKKQSSDLVKFVIMSMKLPKLLDLVRYECDEFEYFTFTNYEIVSEGYAKNMVEAQALIIVLKNLNLIDIDYDISECGKFILCRYITVIN